MMRISMKKLLSCLLLAMVAGCVVAIPILIKKEQEKGYAKVQFDAQGNAADLYAKSVDYTLGKNPAIKVDKDDRQGMHFEGKSVRDGRDYDMKWTVKQVADGKSQFNFELKGAEGDQLIDATEMGKEADAAVKNFCAALQQQCQIAPPPAK